MNETLVAATTAITAIIVLLVLVAWHRRKRMPGGGEPIIELEKLVNCRSCGSLIPEDVRKCAFCGAWQHQEDLATKA